MGKVIYIDKEAVPDPYLKQARTRGDTDSFKTVVPLGSGLLGAAGPMIEIYVVEGIVIILKKVPPADVVHIAVTVVIDPITEDRDEIPGIKDPILVGIEDPGVINIVLDVEHSVLIQVEGARRPIPVSIAGLRQFALIQVELIHEVPCSPFDPGVENSDDDVLSPSCRPPGQVSANATGLSRQSHAPWRKSKKGPLVVVEGVAALARLPLIVLWVVGWVLRKVGLTHRHGRKCEYENTHQSYEK